MSRIAVLTSGGDAPGMNAAIRAVTLVAGAAGAEVWGVDHGYDGLMAGDLRQFGPDDVGGIQARGGTILGTARSSEFRTTAGRAEARRQLQSRGIAGLVVIGGNGSLTGLQCLLQEDTDGLVGVGIPASIDNDIGLTRLAIGVDTAVNTIVEACDKLLDTATSHRRVFIVEVMGRRCGYLAMAAGVAAGAEAVLFPEAAKTEADLVQTAWKAVRTAAGRSPQRRRALILKAEGVELSLDQLKRGVEAKAEEAGLQMDVRTADLGHVVRGGRPSAMDRMVGTRLGHAAVRAIQAGRTGCMASWSSGLAFPDTIAQSTPGDPRTCWVDLAAVLEETEKMGAGDSPYVAWRSRMLTQMEDVFSR